MLQQRHFNFDQLPPASRAFREVQLLKAVQQIDEVAFKFGALCDGCAATDFSCSGAARDGLHRTLRRDFEGTLTLLLNDVAKLVFDGCLPDWRPLSVLLKHPAVFWTLMKAGFFLDLI